MAVTRDDDLVAAPHQREKEGGAAFQDVLNAAVRAGPGDPAVLCDLLPPPGAAGNPSTGAHLATSALEHGAQVCSYDADSWRFPGVRRIDPLREV